MVLIMITLKKMEKKLRNQAKFLGFPNFGILGFCLTLMYENRHGLHDFEATGLIFNMQA